MRHSPSAMLTAAVLMTPLLFAGCASSLKDRMSPGLEASDHTASPAASQEAAVPVTTESSSPAPESGPAQAVEYRLDQEAPLVYSHPEGIDGTFAPAFVIEPAVTYVPAPHSELASRLQPGPPPAPKRRGYRNHMQAPPRTSDAPAVKGQILERTTAGSTPRDRVPAPRPMDPAPALAVDFLSSDFDDNATNNGGFLFIPPDPHGAAGPNHVVSVVNTTIQFHDTAGTKLLGASGASLQSFFAPTSPANFTFDPKVLYDQYHNRFVAVTLERVDPAGSAGNASRILVGVSDDSNPMGTWHFTAIDGKVNILSVDRWTDYPGLAVDEEAVYLTGNMFAFQDGGFGYGGVRMWVIDKDAGSGGGFYGGGTATVLGPMDPYGGGGFPLTTQPAHTYGTAPAGVGTWLSGYSGVTEGELGGNEAIQVMRIDDPTGSPSIVGPFYMSMGNIEDVGGSLGFPELPDASQSGTAIRIEVNDRRSLDAVWRSNRLYVTTTIIARAGVDSGQTTAHWVEMDTTNLAGGETSDGGSLGGEDIASATATFFPSVAVNGSGDVAVGFSASAATTFAGAYYTALPGPAPRTPTDSGTLRAGTDHYNRTFGGGLNRWGDYTATAVDPDDGCFWVFNEYAMTRGTPTSGGEDGRWATRFGKFCVGGGPNTPPVVAITQPPDLWLVDDSDSVSFQGTANDLEDGNITANLQWTSDLDGSIGSGGSFSKVLTEGAHVITAKVTDLGGLMATDQIVVIAASSCQLDVVVSNTTDTSTETYGAANSLTFGDNYTSTSSAVVDGWAGRIVLMGVELGGTVTLGNISGSAGCN